jgi:hypothetical protein
MAERKTAKYYREILNGNNIYKSLEVIPEVMKKFGFVGEYRTEINFNREVVSKNFNWNHSIEGFYLAKDGTLYAHIYWQGDSTDGTESVNARYLIGGYTIKAEWDEVGGDWGRVCRHSPLNVTEEELRKAVKEIVPLLSSDLIKARKKYNENRPFVMPLYGRINKYVFSERPYNRYGDDEYKQKRHNAEDAVRSLVEDAKKYMQMPESECGKLLNKVYELNYKLDSEFKTNAEGEKIYYLAV